MTFITAKSINDGDKEALTAFQLGATWVYADSIDTVEKTTEKHANILADAIAKEPICQISYVFTLAKSIPSTKKFEPSYIAYVVNLGCKLGLLKKTLCKSYQDNTYGCVFAEKNSSRTLRTFLQLDDLLNEPTSLRFKSASQVLFFGKKGSYYWVKCMLEHLIYLGVLQHSDEWSVSRFR